MCASEAILDGLHDLRSLLMTFVATRKRCNVPEVMKDSRVTFHSLVKISERCSVETY